MGHCSESLEGEPLQLWPNSGGEPRAQLPQRYAAADNLPALMDQGPDELIVDRLQFVQH